MGIAGPAFGLSFDRPAREAGHAELQPRAAFQAEPALLARLLDARGPIFLVVGIERLEDIHRGDLAAADRRQHVLEIVLAEAGEHIADQLIGVWPLRPLEGALQDLAAKAGILLAHSRAGRAPDRRARLAGDHHRFPGRRRHLRLRADDLDLVAIMQLGHQRHGAAVDLGADGGVADVGVDGVGEVDRGRAARQRDQPALGGEAEDLVLEQLELGVLEELLRRVALGEHLDRAPQPLISADLLVKPVQALAVGATPFAPLPPPAPLPLIGFAGTTPSL